MSANTKTAKFALVKKSMKEKQNILNIKLVMLV